MSEPPRDPDASDGGASPPVRVNSPTLCVDARRVAGAEPTVPADTEARAGDGVKGVVKPRGKAGRFPTGAGDTGAEDEVEYVPLPE